MLFLAGLLTAVSALVLVVDPVAGVTGLLCFGFCLCLAEVQRRARVDNRTRARIEPFLHRLRRGNVDGYVWLLKVLADMDGRTPRARRRSRIALGLIATNAILMDGLFVHSRRREISVAVFGDRLRRFGAGVLVPALASLHPDGRIRQAAVTAMSWRFRPAHLPFLIERAVDWVPAVRSAAHDILGKQLRRRDLLRRATTSYARVARRKHAPELERLIEEAAHKRPLLRAPTWTM